jgi:hypothetical protein
MKSSRVLFTILLLPGAAFAQIGTLGSAPSPEAIPKLEFVFEERVTISPAVVVGDTALGYRQFIGITGGTVAGPRFKGRVLPGGFDFQLTYKASDCTLLSASYFIQAEDGTNIHVLNEGMGCPGGDRPIFRPKVEAPKGPHEWMTRAAFVATLDLEPPVQKGGNVDAVRIRFYQVK